MKEKICKLKQTVHKFKHPVIYIFPYHVSKCETCQRFL